MLDSMRFPAIQDGLELLVSRCARLVRSCCRAGSACIAIVCLGSTSISCGGDGSGSEDISDPDFAVNADLSQGHGFVAAYYESATILGFVDGKHFTTNLSREDQELLRSLFTEPLAATYESEQDLGGGGKHDVTIVTFAEGPRHRRVILGLNPDANHSAVTTKMMDETIGLMWKYGAK